MGEGFLRVLTSVFHTATRPLRAALRRMERLLDFVRDFIVDFAGDITFMKMVIIGAVATGLALGVGSAVIFIRGDDESPSATAPVATATSVPGAAPTPTTAAPTATAKPSNVVTLRGELDDAVFASSGLAVAEHSVELVLFIDTGSVTGSMVLAIEEFPIGMLLASTFNARDDPEWATFRDCTVRLTLDGVVTGTYDRATGAITGETLMTPVREDVRRCLDSRPPNVSVDGAVESSSFTWTAAFDGRTATGTAQLEPPAPFTATVVE